MGISGLLPFLENSSRKCHISEFRGSTVAIDSYCWLHKGAFACAEKLFRGEQTNAYVTYCMKYIQLLQSYNIIPILVFDGQHLPAKKDTEAKRRDQKYFARAKAMELLLSGNINEARNFIRQCIDITHEMALALIKVCRSMKIDCIVAPYEADAQLAFLNMEGIADIVITEDSDLILFGCSKILFKFNIDGSGIMIEKHDLNMAMKMRPDQYSFEKFRYMCIMSGCDYLDSLPGIGIKRAHKAISMTHDSDIYKLLPRLPNYLNLSKLVVTTDYVENFKLADATIKHQVIYDPVERKLKPLTDPFKSNTDPKYLKNAGEIGDSAKAFQMALGNIDPISKNVLDSWDPDKDVTITNRSIWSSNYKKPKTCLKSESISIPIPTRKKRIEVRASSESFVLDQGNIIDYDKELQEELRMYENLEPMLKRTKSAEGCSKIKVQAIVHGNPFLKRKSSKLSKFRKTTINTNEIFASKFFNSITERNSIKFVENMDAEDDKTIVNGSISNEGYNADPEKLNGCGSPILSSNSIQIDTELNSFKYHKINNLFSHSFDSTVMEKLTLRDELQSSQSNIMESFDLSSEVDNIKQSSSVGFLNNAQFIKKKLINMPPRRLVVSQNVKKSNQPTLISMFDRLNNK
ncbi:hypothetical protein FQR65_LT13359 [Abscondita terminalis]|nr:hypothetical protein FQR65_LT13359 [Abscondita terminalis]